MWREARTWSTQDYLLPVLHTGEKETIDKTRRTSHQSNMRLLFCGQHTVRRVGSGFPCATAELCEEEVSFRMCVSMCTRVFGVFCIM